MLQDMDYLRLARITLRIVQILLLISFVTGVYQDISTDPISLGTFASLEVGMIAFIEGAIASIRKKNLGAVLLLLIAAVFIFIWSYNYEGFPWNALQLVHIAFIVTFLILLSCFFPPVRKIFLTANAPKLTGNGFQRSTMIAVFIAAIIIVAFTYFITVGIWYLQ